MGQVHRDLAGERDLGPAPSHSDRTTVAHACTVIEDRRDDPVFDRALDLLEWAVRSFAIRSAGGRSLSS